MSRLESELAFSGIRSYSSEQNHCFLIHFESSFIYLGSSSVQSPCAEYRNPQDSQSPSLASSIPPQVQVLPSPHQISLRSQWNTTNLPWPRPEQRPPLFPCPIPTLRNSQASRPAHKATTASSFRALHVPPAPLAPHNLPRPFIQVIKLMDISAVSRGNCGSRGLWVIYHQQARGGYYLPGHRRIRIRIRTCLNPKGAGCQSRRLVGGGAQSKTKGSDP